jgi:hypothetical protein
MRYFGITLTLVLFLIISCKKITNTPPADPSISIFYKNSSGNYLFTNNTNDYREDSVRVLKIINGVAIPLDSGYSYSFYSNAVSGKRFLYLAFMNWATIDNATNTILIRLKYNVIDTLKYYGKVSNSLNYDSTTYNGIKQSTSVFEITK